ncbi:hypothetical protein P2G88_19415 [Aliiglaciecola sp. CAU 1673]|uniref:hypothetical protein n=1 Tax=Aliiglaciecola sp. CAU 1673 TaxID=3032595 RepID=UPI0023DCDC89|nr:hypothetical protein [Aliiglaciecola sp. CAU 1673]MDF2180429.1 hypothetical protein [Aliiglaciecola sp. CAU 1673]
MDHNYIPDQPFLRACNNHDFCYATYRNKSYCDSDFLNQMKMIADRTAKDINQDFLIPFELTYGALMSMAYTYHWFVVNDGRALLAYCANKGYGCMMLQGELNVVSENGAPISGAGNERIYAPNLYDGRGFCLMPVYYRTCAYGTCVPDVLYLPCP